MIGEIPISDACHYMDAHDTETVQLEGFARNRDILKGVGLPMLLIRDWGLTPDVFV
jgi:hypothetical protein